jgi:Fe-S oxidoreductase
MSLQGNYNYCCSGGGGVIAMGGETRKQRMQAGKVKADQIKATGAEIVLTGCHNCIDQIRDLNKEYQLGIKALHFKEVIAEHMEIPA